MVCSTYCIDIYPNLMKEDTSSNLFPFLISGPHHRALWFSGEWEIEGRREIISFKWWYIERGGTDIDGKKMRRATASLPFFFFFQFPLSSLHLRLISSPFSSFTSFTLLLLHARLKESIGNCKLLKMKAVFNSFNSQRFELQIKMWAHLFIIIL